MTDGEVRARRRGAALEEAILTATLDELAATGYPQLTMERIAERAGASKASLYRRWPTKVELVLAAVRHRMPERVQVADHGNLRDDLVATFTAMAEQLAGPSGEALRGIIAEALGQDSLAVLSAGTGAAMLNGIVDRAVVRGEVPSDRSTERPVEAGLSMLRYHFLVHHRVDEAFLTGIVDEVMVPLLTGQVGMVARNASVR